MLRKKDRTVTNQIEFVSIGDLVPSGHLLRAIDERIDFQFIYEEVKDLYCENNGRPSIDPVVLIKLIMIQALYGIRSMRQTIQDVEVNVAYRWFLGYGLQEKIPHFSTFGKNYERRFKDSALFETIFANVLAAVIEAGFLKTDAVFIDATHIKASANKNKYIKQMARHRAHKYKRELLAEINANRAEHGKKPLPEKSDDDDDNSGLRTEEEREVKQSTTDPESGLFHKGEKEKCFAYSASVACDRNGFVLGVETAAGNIHDSQVFSDIFTQVRERFEDIEAIVVDAGYKTPGICREIVEAQKKPIMPYRRPMTKEGYFRKYEYVYDEYFDCYLCPNEQVLKYGTTNRTGYQEYRSDPRHCRECDVRMRCTQSQNHRKIVTRHVWEDYVEIAEDLRHTAEGKALYRMRGETIERVFADAKEKHGMRYTHYRGLRKVGHYLKLLFACMNLKKLALWKTRERRSGLILPDFSSFLFQIGKFVHNAQTPLLRIAA
jgi:transposase